MQQGQVFELKKRAVDGSPVWAYRYRTEGPGSRRLQRGGFSSERDAAEALERALERLRRQKGVGSTLTLKELVEEYLAQYDAEPETIDKLKAELLAAAAAKSSEAGAQAGELSGGAIARDVAIEQLKNAKSDVEAAAKHASEETGRKTLVL